MTRDSEASLANLIVLERGTARSPCVAESNSQNAEYTGVIISAMYVVAASSRHALTTTHRGLGFMY